MNDLINDQGFLTNEGKALFQARFGKEVDNLFKIAKDQNQLRVIASILNKIIGDKVADLVAKNEFF
jgi:hypothetical protein